MMERIAEDNDTHRNYSDLAMKKTSSVIGVFPDNKIRILYELDLVSDNAKYVIKGIFRRSICTGDMVSGKTKEP